MKKSIINFFDKIIVLLLGIAGVATACQYECESYANVPPSHIRFPEGTALYGMPSSVFTVIKGEVKDQANNPIPNIRVIADQSDTLYTDAQGKYIYKFDTYCPDFLTFEDIDGDAHGGEFASQVRDIIVTDKDKVNQKKCSELGNMFVKTENVKLIGNQ